MIKMVATDLDGTLLTPKKTYYSIVSKKNKKILHKLADSGIHISLVSSRGIEFCKLVKRKLQLNCSIVACSGTYVEINNRLIFEETLSNKIVKEITDYVSTFQKKPIFIITSDDYQMIAKSWKMNFLEKLMVLIYRIKSGRYYEKMQTKKSLFDNFISNEERGVYKLFVLLLNFSNNDKELVYNKLVEKYQDTVQINKMRRGIEVITKSVTKANGIEKIQEKLKFKDDEIIVIGDDGNDIPMFNRYPYSIVMKKGHYEAKPYALHELRKFKDLYDLLVENYDIKSE